MWSCSMWWCGGAGWNALLLEEPKNRLRALIRLSEHRGAGRLQDLQLREVDHLRRHVDVLDLALRRAEVLLVVRQVVERVLEAILDGTVRRAGRRHVVDRGVDRRQRDRAGRAEREDVRVDVEGRGATEEVARRDR